ncbi:MULTISPECIES: LuxR C-terminal-related transcriptional regulator [unclassified Blastococcus]
MTPDDRAPAPWAAVSLADPAAGAPRERLRALGTPAAREGHLTVRGPGGTGKTHLLEELAAGARRAGTPVLTASAAVPTPRGRCLLLVDDAHRLDDRTADRVRRLVREPGTRAVVAFRPWPRPPALGDLLEDLGGDRELVLLGPVDRETVREWAVEHLGEAVSSALVDVVLEQTAGLPGLAGPLLRSLGGRPRRGGAGVLSPGQPPRLAVPEDVVDRIRADLAGLDEGTRALLHAVAAGAPLDDDVLAPVLGVPESSIGDLVAAGRATGLLTGGGSVVPLVSAVLLATTPPDVTRRSRRRLLGVLLDRGEEPVQLARGLAAAGVRDPRAAALLERHGDAALGSDPALADELLGEAQSSGASITATAARRAQAAVLTGDLDRALCLADTALVDPGAPDRPRAAAVTATVLVQRGLVGRAADLYRLAGSERAGSAALALLEIGAPQEAADVLAGAGRPREGGAATTLAVAEELMAQGVHQSLGAGTDAAAALSTLTRAAALLEPMGRTALLPDTPAALAALVALHRGEPAVGESVLQRAVTADLGGLPHRPRHRILLAWSAMLAGRLDHARELAEAARAAVPVVEPRDEVFLRGLEVGVARRASDAPALLRAWEPALESVVRHPVDLFTLLPLGELVVAAARLEAVDRLRPHLAEARALLARLGDPQLWATSLHWSGAQAAILTDDPAGLRPHAAALVAAARTSPYAATLARAGRTWLSVLAGDVDVDEVVAAGERLSGVGLAWDGSRLAGHAAARTADPRGRSALLACARALCEPAGTDAEPAGRGAAAPAAPGTGALSDREREVARLVVAGQTYREIGGRLYISAKTVEHHVSRMRQRLGAGTRSDLLARLRAELAEGA